jgi:hypothetical protein
MSGKHESMVCRSGSASKHGECQLILSFSEQARRVSCLNLRAKCNGRTALVVCSLWLVQCESKRTQHQQKCGGELRSVAGTNTTSRWRPQVLLLFKRRLSNVMRDDWSDAGTKLEAFAEVKLRVSRSRHVLLISRQPKLLESCRNFTGINLI